MKRWINSFSVAAVTLSVLGSFPSLSWARMELVPGSRYTSARAAAMGDAYLPLGDDGPSGLFYNPASLGKIRNLEVEPVNFSAYINAPFIDSFGLNSYKFIGLESFLPTLKEHPGQVIGAGGQLVSSVYWRGFSMGILFNTENRAVYNNGVVQYRSLYQFIPALGFGVRLGGGIVRLGYSLQLVNQASGDMSVPETASPMGYSNGLSQGMALSHNLGFSMTLPITYLPSLNLVARNVLGANYSSTTLVPFATNSMGTPNNEPMSVDVAVGFQPKIAGGSYFNMVLEYRDALNTSGVSYWGRGAIGTELSIKDVFFARMGWASGYPSAGVGLRKKNGEFSLSVYSEEVGSGYMSIQDVHYLMQYQVRAF